MLGVGAVTFDQTACTRYSIASPLLGRKNNNAVENISIEQKVYIQQINNYYIPENIKKQIFADNSDQVREAMKF